MVGENKMPETGEPVAKLQELYQKRKEEILSQMVRGLYGDTINIFKTACLYASAGEINTLPTYEEYIAKKSVKEPALQAFLAAYSDSRRIAELNTLIAEYNALVPELQADNNKNKIQEFRARAERDLFDVKK